MHYSADPTIKELEYYLDNMYKLSKDERSLEDLETIYNFHKNLIETYQHSYFLRLKSLNKDNKDLIYVSDLLMEIHKYYKSFDLNIVQNKITKFLDNKIVHINNGINSIKNQLDPINAELEGEKGDYEAFAFKNIDDKTIKLKEHKIKQIENEKKEILLKYHECFDERKKMECIKYYFQLSKYKKDIEKIIELKNKVLGEEYIPPFIIDFIHSHLNFEEELKIDNSNFRDIINLKMSINDQIRLLASKRKWYVVIYEMSYIVNDDRRSTWENKLLSNLQFDRIDYIKKRQDNHKELRTNIKMIVNLINKKDTPPI